MSERHRNSIRATSDSPVRKYRRVLMFVVGAFLGLTIARYRRASTEVSMSNKTHLQQGWSNTTFTCVIIVLGEMLVNGTEPSANLRSRMKTARDVFDERQFRDTVHVIFSGGDTARVNKTEADAMSELWEEGDDTNEYYRSRKILHLENQSLSTCQNAYYCIPILQQIRQEHWPKPLQIIVVTSDYHVVRAQLLFEQVFQTVFQQKNDTIIPKIDDVVGAPTIEKEVRQQLFRNEKHWLQPKNIEILLRQMHNHPFQLPTTARLQVASTELDHRSGAR
jgi:hypothetical protein